VQRRDSLSLEAVKSKENTLLKATFLRKKQKSKREI
jgi:hypothetical protein